MSSACALPCVVNSSHFVFRAFLFFFLVLGGVFLVVFVGCGFVGFFFFLWVCLFGVCWGFFSNQRGLRLDPTHTLPPSPPVLLVFQAPFLLGLPVVIGLQTCSNTRRSAPGCELYSVLSRGLLLFPVVT